MTSRAVVHTDDLPPVGMVRDPATGGLIPRGEDLMAAALERMPDVEQQLVAWKRNSLMSPGHPEWFLDRLKELLGDESSHEGPAAE